MTKLRNMAGIALVAMSLLTELAVTSAPAQQVTIYGEPCEYLLGCGYMCD